MLSRVVPDSADKNAPLELHHWLGRISARSMAVMAIAGVLCCGHHRSVADEKPTAPKEPPKILMTLPLFMSPGQSQPLIIRGLRMDQINGVQFPGLVSVPEVTIVKKEQSGPPDRVEASVVGDTLAEIRFTLPPDYAEATLPFTVTSEAGSSDAFELLILHQDQVITEVEPNDSLRKAQPITVGKMISGQISQARDVDVYEFTGEAGQTVVAEVIASRRGSPLDAQLTLYDSGGQIIAIADDLENSRDARLKAKLPVTGVWRIVLLDATDRGNSLNSYLLQLSIK